VDHQGRLVDGDELLYIIARSRHSAGMLGGGVVGTVMSSLGLEQALKRDGIVSALQVLTEMVHRGQTLAELRAGMSKYPQHMINVPVSGRVNLTEHSPIQAAVRASEERLAGRGRVLLRPSGTEPVVRVMVEGEDEAEVRREAAELAEMVARLLNTAA
jgi:phosphoglucosamine mutase